MGETVFDVDGGLNSERPEPVAKVGVQQHGMTHIIKSVIMVLGNAILLRRTRDSFLKGDPALFGELLEVPLNKLGSIIASDRSNT